MHNVTMIYAAEGHPTAARVARYKKKFHWPRMLLRNANMWQGETEDCSAVVLESIDSPLAEAYADRAERVFQEEKLALEADRGRDLTSDEIAAIPRLKIRILKPRPPKAQAFIIDLDADATDKANKDEYLARGIPPSRPGKVQLRKQKAAAAARGRKI